MKAAATGSVSWAPMVRGLGPREQPDTDTESSLPTVGVVAALRELVEEMEEVLSARASGARGGGLDECTGGLNGRFTSPTLGFPGGSLGREGGRGGGGGGGELLVANGVDGRTGEEEPLSFPPVLAGGMGPGDDTTALYVGGGGGGGVERA